MITLDYNRFSVLRFKYNSFLSFATGGMVLLALVLVFAGTLFQMSPARLALSEQNSLFPLALQDLTNGENFGRGFRLVNFSVILVTVLTTFWIVLRDPRPFLRRICYFAVFFVVIQALWSNLGTFILMPRPAGFLQVVMGHVFFALTVVIAYFHSKESYLRELEVGGTESFLPKGFSAVMTVFVFAVLCLWVLIQQSVLLTGLKGFYGWITWQQWPRRGQIYCMIPSAIYLMGIFILSGLMFFMLFRLLKNLKHHRRLAVSVFLLPLLLVFFLVLQVAAVTVWHNFFLNAVIAVVGSGLLGLSVLLGVRTSRPRY